jgi:hypothetical protein
MTNVAIALVASFTLGLGASALTHPASNRPIENSCKAAGQPCSDKEDCCSRMCRRDTKKCAYPSPRSWPGLA